MTNRSPQTSEVTTFNSALLEHIRICVTSSVQDICQAVLTELRSRSNADQVATIWQTDMYRCSVPT